MTEKICKNCASWDKSVAHSPHHGQCQCLGIVPHESFCCGYWKKRVGFEIYHEGETKILVFTGTDGNKHVFNLMRVLECPDLLAEWLNGVIQNLIIKEQGNKK